MSTSNTTNHPNSRKITIFRKSTFAEAAQTNAAEFMSMSKKSIGSYWDSRNSKGIGSGLSFEERDILMPDIINVHEKDKDFRKSVENFFASLTTPVAYEDGITLEIGLKRDNKQPITHKGADGEFDNLPIAPFDYVRYRHALRHPKVAPSADAAKGNVLVDYYIFDPEVALQVNVEANKERDQAIQNYFKIKDDARKIDAMLVLMGSDPREFYGVNKDQEKLEKLRNYADIEAKKFNEEYDGKLFEEKFLLLALENTGIVKRMGNQYVVDDTKKILGNNKDEAMFFFKDPANADTTAILKGQLQEAMRKEIRNKKRLPVGKI